jgi:hypothetical protein
MKTVKVVYTIGSQETTFSIDIPNIKYRVTTFSLYIEHEGKEHRFDGLLVLDVKNLIEVYSTYRSILATHG